MGQYHYIVNLDKREYVCPIQFGIGLKAFEQIASMPSTPQALFALLIASNGRGGGDLVPFANGSEEVIGRWAGDRIAVIGDYAEDGDLHIPDTDPASRIYNLCFDGIYREISHLVRPIVAVELGIEYIAETQVFSGPGGRREEFTTQRFRRDPKAAFSVLD